ncbi:MAG: PAS domain-containing protein [Pseudomonadota bacterium]
MPEAFVHDAQSAKPGLGFLDGGGEMGERIRAFDWTAHPLGPAQDWPAALKVAVSLCLHSSFATAIYWGPDLHLIYNDSWARAFDDRQPRALGQRGAEARRDSWALIGPQFAAVVASGEGLSTTDQLVPLVRNGVRSDSYWTYSISPIRNEDGRVCGVLSQGIDVTAKMLAGVSLRASEERLQMALDASGTVGTWEWDFSNDRFVADERMARLYGIDTALAQQGAPVSAYLSNIHPDDYLQFSRAMQAALVRETAVSTECRLLLPDGAERWLSVRGRSRNGPDGRLQRLSGVTLDITEAKRSEAALRDAKDEREFILALVERQRVQQEADDVMQITAEAIGRRLAVDRAGFFQVSDDSVIHYGACWVGGALEPLTGSMPSILFGEKLGEIVRAGGTLAFGAPDDPVRPADAALDVTGTVAGMSVPLVRDGRWQAGFYLSHAKARAWTPGEIALVEEVAQLAWDAVARVRATASLRAMNESLAGEVAERTAERDRIWEVSQDLLGISDINGRWQTVNPAWTHVLGWTADEIVGRTSAWMHHPDDVERTRREIADVVRGDAVAGFENRFRTRSGDYRILAWRATFVDGRIYATARDVTDERRRQAEFLAAEERTRLVLEAMDGVGVWTYDVAADRFNSDASFAALYGFDAAQQANGATMAEVLARIHPDDVPKVIKAIGDARDVRGDGEIEYRLLRPDGSMRWIMTRSHVVLNAAGMPETAIGVGVDVTRQRELEDRLRQAQKMEAVGQLTGGLAHDFNNLLTAISGAMEMMQMRLKQGRIADLPRYIGAAQTASGRAAALTHRLLAFARRQPLDPRPIDVNRLIAGMEDLIRGTVGPGVMVQVVGSPAQLPTLVDPNQLENALLNLCINARDAMPDGGRLTIEAGTIRIEDRDALERDLEPGEYVTLCVGDTGTGMTPEVIARAFDPFFTTKPMGQGTGLGLSMIYGFARQSGGQVRIHSVVGEGTTMCLYLPHHRGNIHEDGEARGAGEAPRSTSGEVVLVVDDEPAVRMLVTEILGELGYAAIQAGDGAEALAILESDARIDLLVTDVGLPGGMNGRQVADAARAVRPDIPVLFITGFAENAVVGDGPLDPGMELVTKPFSMEALAARIRDMIGRR